MSSHRDDEGAIDIKPLESMITIEDIKIQDAKDLQAMAPALKRSGKPSSPSWCPGAGEVIMLFPSS